MMNRAQRRAAAKRNKKNENPELQEKMTLFGKLPDECQACLEPFDKKDKNQVMSWSVVVRNDTEQVRLYCPDCWSKAKAVVEAYEKENGRDKE
jgi:ribosomal protein L44E